MNNLKLMVRALIAAGITILSAYLFNLAFDRLGIFYGPARQIIFMLLLFWVFWICTKKIYADLKLKIQESNKK